MASNFGRSFDVGAGTNDRRTVLLFARQVLVAAAVGRPAGVVVGNLLT